MPAAPTCVNSASPRAVPWTTVVWGAYRQPSVVEMVPSLPNSERAVASTPSAMWMRYALLPPPPKFVHTPSAALVVGKSVATWTLSAPRSFGVWSIVRASEPKHAWLAGFAAPTTDVGWRHRSPARAGQPRRRRAETPAALRPPGCTELGGAHAPASAPLKGLADHLAGRPGLLAMPSKQRMAMMPSTVEQVLAALKATSADQLTVSRAGRGTPGPGATTAATDSWRAMRTGGNEPGVEVSQELANELRKAGATTFGMD